MVREAALFAKQSAADLVGYRNYLLTLWKGMYRQPSITPDEATKQLNRRFHQDFTTTESALKPAHDLVNEILRAILTAPIGADHGFGVATTTIEAQGTRPASVYQTYLLGLTSLDVDEISLRYRIDLPRPAGTLSSPVIENITTLLGFYRDSFQCAPEPFPTIPPPADIVLGGFPEHIRYEPPFFLEFTEWLERNRPFYGENLYQIRPAFAFEVPLGWMPILGESAPDYLSLPTGDLNKDLREGQSLAAQGEFALAAESFSRVEHALAAAFGHPNFRAATPGAGFYTSPVWVFAPEAVDDFVARQSWKLKNVEDLRVLTLWFNPTIHEHFPWRRIQFGLVHLAACALPVILGDLAMATGDYASAVRQYLRTFEPNDLVGMASSSDSAWRGLDKLQQDGDVPYTYDSYGGHLRRADDDLTIYPFPPDLFIRQGFVHPMEKKFFRLRLGNALLEWADSLYRTQDPSSLARARELYKGVSWLHGEAPPIAPDWRKRPSTFHFPDEILGVDPASTALFFNAWENPALVSQKARARLGLFQLDAGLNYYGYSDDVIPTLRYRTLKDSADRLAHLAKGAQTDFLSFMEKIEALQRETLQITNLARKAALQASLADQEIAIAQAGVVQAKAQRDSVLAAIAAKEAEIAKHDDFFGQLGDYLGGMIDIVGKVKGAGVSPAHEGEGSDKSLSGVDLGVTTLEGGGAIMAGFGAFWVASYLTLDSMTDAANARRTDLSTLFNTTLPAAEAQIVVKERSVTIGEIRKKISQADADLADDLLHFDDRRFLNAEFWATLATVIKRILRRYLDLGARNAWLAERALAYEQDTEVDVIRFDYFPANRQGMPGADFLQADLEELEAQRLNGIRSTVPIKHTFSLARDFPLQFGQLKKTGQCVIHTQEQPLQWAYPGTYGYRLRAVTPVVQTLEASPAVRGLLTHQGITTLTREDGTSHVLVRPQESLPLSEFRMRDDMALYGLPDEALLTFEGSGVDAFWTLEFTSMANPYGLGDVTDILLTFDAKASHSSKLRAVHLATQPKTVHRLVAVSAQRYQPLALAALRNPATTSKVKITFDMSTIGLSKSESNRRISNLVILFAGTGPVDLSVQVNAAVPSISKSVPIKNGVAISNAAPIGAPGDPPAPMNDFVGLIADQALTLTVDPGALPADLRARLGDIVLAIDYVADRA